jgi:hypothetical protein
MIAKKKGARERKSADRPIWRNHLLKNSEVLVGRTIATTISLKAVWPSNLQMDVDHLLETLPM